ncbi:hypothetical protein G6F47_010978 [Rhizopus delemar]|nr:hypothetical protein G6F54_009505 [Rhizopus delemar]KAG1514687.1 hypothetical protein G6F53_003495 [Rhizopus delemar]KAG1587283.1 hypothetical protein G6F47_010978 [Rhizopus delemar]
MTNINYSIPDLVCKHSPVLFVGVNPSTSNTGSDVGHYFAGPKNQFFRLLHASGLLKNVDTMVKVDTDLHHQYRISFTNYVKIASKTEKSLTAEQMIEGKQQLVELIDKWEPEVICFLGVKCLKHFVYRNQVALGEQPTYKGMRLYCLPNTSSLGTAYSYEKKKHHYNLRRHIKRRHGHDLPSRKRSDQLKKGLDYNQKNAEKYPNAVVAFACPCCNATLSEREALKKHIEEIHIIRTPKLEAVDGTCAWVIEGVDILTTFYAYSEANRLQQTDIRFLVKNDAERILSLSAIFVLKKQKESPFLFSANVQEMMYHQVMKRTYHGDSVSDRVQRKVKKIIKDYVAGTIDNDEARYKIFAFLRKSTGSNRVVLRCIQAVLPGTFSSAVADISEAELLASYVHPFMQALFSGWEPQRVPHAADKVFSEDMITNNARPDYIVDVYQQVDVRYANVIGELKVKGANKKEIAKDFCRVALLLKEIVDKNKLTAAMGFQAIDKRHNSLHIFSLCTSFVPRHTLTSTSLDLSPPLSTSLLTKDTPLSTSLLTKDTPLSSYCRALSSSVLG